MIQIIGKGGFAREVACYVKDNVFFFENEEIENANTWLTTVIGIGDPHVRKRIAEKYSQLSYGKIHAGRDYGLNNIGDGSIICPGTILTTNVTIGKHSIANLNCTIGHDVVIKDFVTLSPGVNVSGNVTIGECCYIGTNAVIIEKITICDNVIIGAGGVVVKDITEPGTYIGNPVRKIK